MLVAKEKHLSGKNGGVLIHFYGEGAFEFGKKFPAIVSDTHPFQALCDHGFTPIGDVTWIRK